MKNHLTNSFFSAENLSAVTNWFNTFSGKVESTLSTADNMHVVAIILSIIILIASVFIAVFVVVNILAFILFRKKRKARVKPQAENKEQPEPEEATEEEVSEEILEYELQSELAQNETNQKVADEKIKDISSEKEDILLQEELRRSVDDRRELSQKEKSLIELDWKKTSRGQSPQSSLGALSQQQSIPNVRKNLHDLVGMVVNMVGRNIDELKIAQALMYRCKEDLSEESVLQIVHSIKEFLNLCNQGAFDNVRRKKDLPSDEDCLVHLISGDTSYAMALMEALMDDRINQAVSMKNMTQREALFKQSSNYACYFGTLAEMNDVNLASASFELAIEMDPNNPLAWSRCADLYKKIGMEDKANWAYRNVLKLAKQNESKSQEANAHKYLSQYLYAQGEGNQASLLYMQSKNYYDSIGINRPLDRKELEIIDLIDHTEKEKIIESVLSNRQISLSN